MSARGSPSCQPGLNYLFRGDFHEPARPRCSYPERLSGADAHPELSFNEHWTSDIVVRELAARGLEVHRGLVGTGNSARLRAAVPLACEPTWTALPVDEKMMSSPGACARRPGDRLR